jgi:hypothetical protein
MRVLLRLKVRIGILLMTNVVGVVGRLGKPILQRGIYTRPNVLERICLQGDARMLQEDRVSEREKEGARRKEASSVPAIKMEKQQQHGFKRPAQASSLPQGDQNG